MSDTPEAGPANGLRHSSARLAVHIYSFGRFCRPLLASAVLQGCTSVSCGYGLDATFFPMKRSAMAAVGVAVDIIAFMDAVKIERATIAGFDWGSRTVNIMAALWPERWQGHGLRKRYLIGSQEAGQDTVPPKAELPMVV